MNNRPPQPFDAVSRESLKALVKIAKKWRKRWPALGGAMLAAVSTELACRNGLVWTSPGFTAPRLPIADIPMVTASIAQSARLVQPDLRLALVQVIAGVVNASLEQPADAASPERKGQA